jgi:hypothetical protein
VSQFDRSIQEDGEFTGVVDAASNGLVTIVVDVNCLPRIKEGDAVAVVFQHTPQQHEHRYAVFYAKCTSDRLALVCATGTDEECTEVRFIPNLSPFVVPE